MKIMEKAEFAPSFSKNEHKKIEVSLDFLI